MLSTQNLREIAIRLAETHAAIEAGIEKIYWFPATDEIRFVELDSTTLASDRIEPFYFGPDREGGIPLPSGVAVIRTEEVRKLQPPDGWGSWEDAELIWERK
jgi:hypothetical protein